MLRFCTIAIDVAPSKSSDRLTLTWFFLSFITRSRLLINPERGRAEENQSTLSDWTWKFLHFDFVGLRNFRHVLDLDIFDTSDLEILTLRGT